MKKHLAIFTPSVLDKIFSGEKTIETRFSQKKIPPFKEIEIGDVVYLKPAGADITGQFIVKKVIFFEGLEPADIDLINSQFGAQIAQVIDKPKCKYGTLIFVDQVEKFIVAPLKVAKSDRRGWVVLS